MVCLGSWRRFLFTAGVTGGTAEWFQVYARLLYMSTVFRPMRVFFFTASARSPEVSAGRNIAPFNRGCRQVAERAKGSAPGRPSRSADFERGDVQIGRHRRQWLIHASSTATVPSASRVAVGEGWTSRTGVPSRGRHPHRSRGRTNQHDAAVEKGDVRFGRYQARGLSTPRPRRRSPASRVAVGEEWISRTGVSSRGRHPARPGVVRISTRRQMKRAMFRSNGTSARCGLSTPRPRRRFPQPVESRWARGG